jgi:hypothetical protein
VNIQKDKIRILSDVSYHDYILLICATDAEWSRRGFSGEKNFEDCFNNGFKEITTNSWKYRCNIDRNHTNWLKANNKYWKDKDSIQVKNYQEPIQNYLYNPICYTPFGHINDLSLILLDDCDPVSYLTAANRTMEEEICFALCPKMKDIVSDNSNNIFCDLDKLLELNSALKKGRVNIPKSKDDDKTYEMVDHKFQKSLPLLFFTKFKISELGVLGEGLLFQNALFKAMAERINVVIESLKNDFKGEWKDWIKPGDLNNLKVTFIDMQGPEEIGTLFFCRNYSVAIACIAALRNLIFDDIFTCDKGDYLKNALKRSEVHKKICSTCVKIRTPRQKNNNDVVSKLKYEHAFRWTESILALGSKAFIKNNFKNCNGFVDAFSELQISPGHRLSVENRINEIKDKIRIKDQNAKYLKLDSNKPLIYCSIGKGDLKLNYCTEGEEKRQDHKISLIATNQLWSEVLRYIQEFRPKNQNIAKGRDVVDIKTWLNIPIPMLYGTVNGETKNLLLMKQDDKHLSPLWDMLAKTQETLCFSKKKNNTRGRLSFEQLSKSNKLYGIPISLRRTIEYMYNNFAVLIADPFLFEVVLDIYDTLATLHALLTEHLPKLLMKPGRKKTNLVYLDEGRVEQLAMLIEAVQNAMLHSLAKAYPEFQKSDMAIDFRGGLNQILHSADSVMKCGLSVLRKHVIKERKKGSQNDYERDIVGVPTIVSCIPGARCYSLNFGTEDKAQLAFLKVDVPHVLHTPSYLDYLHEAFHLIFNRKKEYQDMDEVMYDRISEIYTILLCQIFIFGDDVKSAWLYYIEKYSKSLTSSGTDDTDTIVRFTELLIRLFFALDAIEGMGDDARLSWSEKQWHRKEENNIDNVLKQFKKWLKKVGPFFSKYEELWKEDSQLDAKGYCLAQFKSIYQKVVKIMPDIWSDTTKLYKEYVEGSIGKNPETFQKMNQVIEENVKKGFLGGYPLIRGMYLSLNTETGSKKKRNR